MFQKFVCKECEDGPCFKIIPEVNKYGMELDSSLVTVSGQCAQSRVENNAVFRKVD